MLDAKSASNYFAKQEWECGNIHRAIIWCEAWLVISNLDNMTAYEFSQLDKIIACHYVAIYLAWQDYTVLGSPNVQLKKYDLRIYRCSHIFTHTHTHMDRMLDGKGENCRKTASLIANAQRAIHAVFRSAFFETVLQSPCNCYRANIMNAMQSLRQIFAYLNTCSMFM